MNKFFSFIAIITLIVYYFTGMVLYYIGKSIKDFFVMLIRRNK